MLATTRSLFPGYNIQPLEDGLVLAYLKAATPAVLFYALEAFTCVAEAPAAGLPKRGKHEDAETADPDLGWDIDVDKDVEYLLGYSSPRHLAHQMGGGGAGC